ncbi:MAG: hypothetical protein DME17_18665 [Candidatus Rokuibacteriota bacterium]|nr:MAG: hypothetical protein DME17_18665 [Candidatus Rokubacteria bacterium]
MASADALLSGGLARRLQRRQRRGLRAGQHSRPAHPRPAAELLGARRGRRAPDRRLGRHRRDRRRPPQYDRRPRRQVQVVPADWLPLPADHARRRGDLRKPWARAHERRRPRLDALAGEPGLLPLRPVRLDQVLGGRAALRLDRAPHVEWPRVGARAVPPVQALGVPAVPGRVQAHDRRRPDPRRRRGILTGELRHGGPPDGALLTRRLTVTRRFRCAAIPVLLCASALAPAAAEAKPRVVATLADLWAVTEQLVDGQVDVELATHFGQNPHDFEIRPSQILLVKRADLLIRNGLEEDAWIDPIVESSGNPKLLRGSPNVVEAAQGVQVLKIPRGPIDRSLGDVHPLGNPHFVADPRNLPIVSANIVAGLSRIMPELAATFEANRTAFLAKVGAAYAGWRQTLAPHRGFGLVSYHDSWPYFEQAFDLAECGIEEDRPGIPPSPQHLTLLIRAMKEKRCTVILHESWYPTDVSAFVARETGAKVLIVPQTPGAVPGTKDYFTWMDFLVDSLARALP